MYCTMYVSTLMYCITNDFIIYLIISILDDYLTLFHGVDCNLSPLFSSFIFPSSSSFLKLNQPIFTVLFVKRKRGKQENENNYNFALLKRHTHKHTHTRININYFRHICMNSLRFAYYSDWASSALPSSSYFSISFIQIGVWNPISHLSFIDYNCSTADEEM